MNRRKLSRRIWWLESVQGKTQEHIQELAILRNILDGWQAHEYAKAVDRL